MSVLIHQSPLVKINRTCSANGSYYYDLKGNSYEMEEMSMGLKVKDLLQIFVHGVYGKVCNMNI